MPPHVLHINTSGHQEHLRPLVSVWLLSVWLLYCVLCVCLCGTLKCSGQSGELGSVSVHWYVVFKFCAPSVLSCVVSKAV